MATRDSRWENVYASVRNNTTVEFFIEVRHNDERCVSKIYVLREDLDNPDFDRLYQKVLDNMVKNLDDFMEDK